MTQDVTFNCLVLGFWLFFIGPLVLLAVLYDRALKAGWKKRAGDRPYPHHGFQAFVGTGARSHGIASSIGSSAPSSHNSGNDHDAYINQWRDSVDDDEGFAGAGNNVDEGLNNYGESLLSSDISEAMLFMDHHNS